MLWLLLLLALAGTALSVYFTLAYYGRVESREVPAALCQHEERACITILETPYARLLGVPNSLLGIGFYLLTGVVAALALAEALPRWLSVNVAVLLLLWKGV
jgi:uncharacterized membrane protein